MIIRVLCVDDRSQLLQIRKDILERLGFSVVTARSASSAIAALEVPAIAAVLLEYKSEGIDAEAVALHIKRRFPDVPIVLLSAYSDMPERVLWLVDEYVLRSQPVEQLTKIIEQVAKSSHRFPGGSPRESLKRAV